MSIHNIQYQYKNENHPKLSQIYSYCICSKGPKNEFKTDVVNEPSVFEPWKFYCNLQIKLGFSGNHVKIHSSNQK